MDGIEGEKKGGTVSLTSTLRISEKSRHRDWRGGRGKKRLATSFRSKRERKGDPPCNLARNQCKRLPVTAREGERGGAVLLQPTERKKVLIFCHDRSQGAGVPC